MKSLARKILILSSLALAAVGAGSRPLAIDAPARFVDVTRSSGIRFLHHNSATPNKYLIETMGGGVALLDYDNDGWLDVFFTNGARIKDGQRDGEPLDKSSPEYWDRLFRNNRDGTFTDVTEKAGVRGRGYGMGVAVADYDNDGDEDLLVTGYNGGSLYRNNGGGTFTDITAKAGINIQGQSGHPDQLGQLGWMTSAGFFDYDNDGRLDMFICRYLQWDFAVGSVFCGDNRPGGRGYCHPDKFKPVSNLLFKNNGDGTFTDVSEASGVGASAGKALGVAFNDYNNDGWVDIFVANDSHPQFLFKNNGDGTFAETGLVAGVGYSEDGKTFAGMGADFADIDDDGWADIVATALPYEYYAFFKNRGRNKGKSGFQYLSLDSGLGEITRLYGGWGMRIFDYDNDGAKDIFFANSHVMDNIARTQPHLSYEQRLLLVTFDGSRFTNVSPTSGEVFTSPSASRGAAFGDLDNDGDIDIVVASCNGPARLLRNDGGNANHWIAVELRGVRASRDGVGAKIILTRQSGRRQYGIVSTAGSYLSANDRRVYFGLGNDSAIRQIRIEWPGGAVQEIVAPKSDQILRVEGRGAGGDSRKKSS
jgi:enediyne biosynthesis protein E4